MAPLSSSGPTKQNSGLNPFSVRPGESQRTRACPVWSLSDLDNFWESVEKTFSVALACMLCRRAKVKPGVCGVKLLRRELCFHKFCLQFASHVPRRPSRLEGCTHFRYADIRAAIERAAEKNCFVCRRSGAATTCQEVGCERSFHLPCAIKGGCVTQYFPPYRTFCSEHRPQQSVEAAQEGTTRCVICLGEVDGGQTYRTLLCPACKHAWFHRKCIQGQARRDGITQLRCPLCRDTERFRGEMLRIGGRVPFRTPELDQEAFAELSARHGRCDASECLCPGGRERAERDGPWELLLCSSCAAEGTHRSCSRLQNSRESWECQGCAGPRAESRATPEPAGPTTRSREAPEPESGSSGSSRPGPLRAPRRSRSARQDRAPYGQPGPRRRP